MAAILYATSLGILMLGLMPALEPLLREQALLSAGQVGRLYALELAAMGLASLPALWWRRRRNRAAVAGIAYGAFAAGSALSALAHGSGTLLAAARALAGIGAGTLMVLGMTAAAQRRDPGRAYALITLTQLISAALALWSLPALVADGRGTGVVFLICALLGLAGLAGVPALARAGRGDARPRGDAEAPAAALVQRLALPLAAALLFNLQVGGLWAFCAEFGQAAGLAAAAVERGVNAAAGAGIAAAAAALALAARPDRRRMLVAAQAAIAVGALLMHLGRSGSVFALGCCVFSFGWNFGVPCLLAAVAARDASAGAMSFMNIAFTFGLALGPMLYGTLLDAGGTSAVLHTALATAGLGMLLLARLGRAPPRG